MTSVAGVHLGLVFLGAEWPAVRGHHRPQTRTGAWWETPGPDDAGALVEGLVRSGIVVRDQLVADVLQGHRPAVSGCTVERRFRAATGLLPLD